MASMTHTLIADNIRWSFGDRPILTGTNIRCRTGAITGLLGRNGTGKTSLMRIMYGDLAGEHQKITIDDEVLRRPYTQPDRIRYMPQFNFMPVSLTPERICLDFTLDIRGLITAFPEFEAVRRQRIKYLSTGQRRLINIYVISRSQSQFIMLDEPFTLLSPIQAEKVKSDHPPSPSAYLGHLG
jgi:ABC-type multidrug transport system ATPase subunit